MSSKIGVAVVGFGRMGMIHMKNVMASARATPRWIVVGSNVPKAQNFIAGHSLAVKCATSDSIEDVLDDKSVDALVICSPTDTHEPLLRQALEANKAVLCEKPLTTARSTSEAMYVLAKERKLPLLCAFHRRFDPSFRQLKEDIAASKLGRLRLLKGSSHDFMPPTPAYVKTSGGIFVDSTVHDLDMSLWVSGGKPLSVYATGNAFDPEIGRCDDVDLVTVTIRYDNGVMSVIDNGRQASYGYDQRLEAICDEGMLSVTNRPVNQVYRFTDQSLQMPRCDTLFNTRYAEAFRNEMEHFLDVVQGKCEPEITGTDTLTTLKIVEACNESLKTGVPVTMEAKT